MKFVDLKTTLQNTVHNVYFITGDDRALVQKAQDMIVRKCASNLPELNFVILDGEEFSMQTLIENAQTVPFCNDYRVILVRNLVSVNEKDCSLFDSYLNNPVKSTIILFIFDEEDNFYKKFCNQVEVVDCCKLTRPFLARFVATALSKYGYKITVNALDLFLEFCQDDFGKIENEIEKLKILDCGETITSELIMQNVPKSVDYQIFELGKTLAVKDCKTALDIFNFLLDRKISTQYILTTLSNTLRRMFYVSITDDTDYNISKMLGIHEYAVKYIRIDAKNFKKSQLKQALELCLKLDLDIKNGKFDDVVAINRLIFELTR